MVKQLIEKTQTKTGLGVSVSIIDKVYEIGKRATDGFKESIAARHGRPKAEARSPR